jgi:hypothetical protein
VALIPGVPAELLRVMAPAPLAFAVRSATC